MPRKTSRSGNGAAATLAAARNLTPELIRTRREIHARPELGYEEKETSRLVRTRLQSLKLKPRIMATTGVAALVPGRKPGRVLMIRCDMDALPIQEETDFAYRSRIDGKMHACGHDLHTSILLGAARLLTDNPPDTGVVKLNFQPAEEGLNGAGAMIEAGVMERPDVEAALGYHIWQGIPVGKVGVVSGPAMAAVDRFTITVRGVGGHAAYPHLAVDPILIGSQVVNALQSIASRSVNPQHAAVVTVASFHGGTAFNIIPPSVELTGTVRTFTKEARDTVERRMRRIVKQIAAGMGGAAEIDYRRENPAVVNDAKLAAFMRDVASDVVGSRNVVDAEPSMGGEDMAFYQEKVPGCYIFVGSGPKGDVYPHHHPKFNPDEGVMPIAAAIMTEAARRWLKDSPRTG